MDDWLHTRAKTMRREPALYERRLWVILRDRRLEGLKFRRQVVIGRYVADFVCLRHRLIVEADGPHHDDPLARADDAERQALLEAAGERVVRVTWEQAVARQRATLHRVATAGAPRAAS